MAQRAALLSALLAAAGRVHAQQACTSTTETKPSLAWSTCTSSGCTNTTGPVTIDANWRWTHEVDGYTNCYTGNEWDTSICTDDATCAEKCCVDGADYESTYGITATDSALKLAFVTGSNVGSRTFLMASDTEYEMFKLLGKEFTFDVDVSNLPCGLNGALYFVSMDADGGLSKYSGNKAGAAYGTGYCDSQCPRDLKFINGQANVEDWTPSTNDANSGVGNHGSCCAEMDVWEANIVSTALTPHSCSNTTQHMCDGDSCGGTYSTDRYAGDCDPDGCDFNPYRMGNTSFYGSGSEFNVDTSKVFTVVTQFLTDDSGTLNEIKRFYVQDGVVIGNAESDMSGVSGNSITTDYCTAEMAATNATNYFEQKGGFNSMSTAMESGMVLVMSLWDDHYANMLWLDSTSYPVDATGAGTARGTCATSSGAPTDVESTDADSYVIYSNIKIGDIGTTFASS
ncbi:putative 1,4-beta-D-glucan cellobiohydrolase B [Cytospora mali]|uniref:Glucanase n=1 Tax=Cytospora mali TaxID=578113 RepID=A0A194W002_CYTMA|nr:putative 1,4-beta-D-glucan cellobiohydrolase B [Valsa mali]